jgi:ABC-type nickel/cobalt efflux system permease component RcnA/cytochrome c556
METYLLIIFWYGILHAFGPDHLMAIADFSIGKSKKKTFAITLSFAFGHGMMLFIFAKVLELSNIPQQWLAFADTISAGVILAMGLYLLYLVTTNRIHLKKHTHEGKEHIHIWFGKSHDHSSKDTASVFTIGLLMGLGGVRGMLITLGAIGGASVDLVMVIAFILGVSVVFLLLGVVIYFINQNFLTQLSNVRKAFATVGAMSAIVGLVMLTSGTHSHAITDRSALHTHTSYLDADALVQSKKQSDMTYKQMMQQMGEAYLLMQKGLLMQDSKMVKQGASMIDNHPAPKEKPWSIVKKEDQASFKQTLIAYNDLLHEGAHAITQAITTKDWVEIQSSIHALSAHCVSCHSAWKDNLK